MIVPGEKVLSGKDKGADIGGKMGSCLASRKTRMGP